jgi:hypothetical protein
VTEAETFGRMGEDLTVAELREALEGLDDDMPVRLAQQPSWPFEYRIEAVAICRLVPRQDSTDADLEEVVYLVEGEQARYLPPYVASSIGWQEHEPDERPIEQEEP